jgi:hypothetical protein
MEPEGSLPFSQETVSLPALNETKPLLSSPLVSSPHVRFLQDIHLILRYHLHLSPPKLFFFFHQALTE